MKKNCLIAFIIGLISYSLFAQKKIADFKNSLKENSTDIKDVIPIVNTENDELAIFIADAKNVYGYKLNSNFIVKEQLSSETKKRKYKVLLGSSIKNNDYRIFLSNNDKSQFAYINFSFDNQKKSTKEFILPSGQTFLQTVSVKNKFYILSANKITGTLLINFINHDEVLQYFAIDLTKTTFLNKKGKEVIATDLLFPFNNTPIKKFEKDTPNSIEAVSDNRKMYLKGDDIVITFDHNKSIAQVLTINLNSKKVSKNIFKKPLAHIKSGRKKTNSFIYDNRIALIAATKEVFVMHILNYNTNEFIKEYVFSKDEQITFKNSPIIQEGGFYNNYRALEKSKKFLRKVTSNKIGVSIIRNKGDYQFTIGGYVNQRSGGAPMMMMGGFGGFPMASFGNVSVFFNPTMLAYNSFTNTKSTRIECLFNSNFEHIKDKEFSKNIFDKIKSSYTRSKVAETVFKYKNFFIKGDYNSNTRMYSLKKFTR